MGKGKCFVPGCTSGYDSDRQACKAQGKRTKSLFQAPRDPDLFEIWKKVIPRVDKQLTKNDRVCELHFLEQDVVRYYITNMPDGTVHKLERGSNALKPGAIPCIFPGLPNYLTGYMKRKKRDQQPNAVKTSRKKIFKNDTDLDAENIPDNSHSALEMKKSADTNAENIPDNSNSKNDMSTESPTTCNESLQADMELPAEYEFTFGFLQKNLNMIKKPSQWYCFALSTDHILCVKWNTEFVAERRIVIGKDLNVKVFLKDSQSDVSNDVKINSFDDISMLLEEVDSLILCKGFQKESEKTCLLYLPEKNGSQGKEGQLCEECKKTKRRVAYAIKCQQDKAANKICIYRKLNNEKKKTTRLTKKVAKLKRQLEVFKKIHPSKNFLEVSDSSNDSFLSPS